jgi:hypothetical protein
MLTDKSSATIFLKSFHLAVTEKITPDIIKRFHEAFKQNVKLGSYDNCEETFLEFVGSVVNDKIIPGHAVSLLQSLENFEENSVAAKSLSDAIWFWSSQVRLT